MLSFATVLLGLGFTYFHYSRMRFDRLSEAVGLGQKWGEAMIRVNPNDPVMNAVARKSVGLGVARGAFAVPYFILVYAADYSFWIGLLIATMPLIAGGLALIISFSFTSDKHFN